MITNNPKILSYVTHPYVYWDNFFTDDELNLIEKYCIECEFPLDKGIDYSDGVNERDGTPKSIRKSDVKFIHKTKDSTWIFDRLNAITDHINCQFYNYDLTGYGFLQYTEYNKKGDLYGYHTDMVFGDINNPDIILPRKLSFSLILSDPGKFKGGDFEFDIPGNTRIVEQKRGRIIAFPSFVKHQVTPIKSGVRKSIVWWAVGPKFK